MGTRTRLSEHVNIFGLKAHAQLHVQIGLAWTVYLGASVITALLRG